MKTVLRIVLVAVIVGAAVALYVFVLRPQSGPGEVTTKYMVARGPIEQTVPGTGVLESAVSATIASKVKGKYAKPLVKEGQEVEADQLLMRITNDEIDTAVNLKQAEIDHLKKDLEEIRKPVDERSDVKKAKTAWERAKREYDRLKQQLDDEEENIRKGLGKMTERELKELRDDVSFAQDEADQAKDAYDKAREAITEADITEAEEKVTQAESELTKLKEEAAGREVRSPIAGTVLKVMIEPEDLDVEPDKEYPKDTPLFVVADLSSLFVRGMVYQSDAALLDRNRINDPDLPNSERIQARVQLPSSAHLLTGYLTYLSLTPSESATGVRQFEVKISFPSPPEGVTDGLQVTFNIIIAQLDNVLVIPVKYVELEGPTATVRKLVNGRLERTVVQLGVSDTNSYQVLGGLSEGDVIVWESPSK